MLSCRAVLTGLFALRILCPRADVFRQTILGNHGFGGFQHARQITAYCVTGAFYGATGWLFFVAR